MSTVAKPLETIFYSPTRQLQQQRQKAFAHNQQQLNGKILIDSTADSHKKYVINKEIETKRFSGQTIKAENKNKNSNSQDIKETLIKELREIHSTEQQISETEDYQTYQNGKIREFFENDVSENTNRVADICLVNDHFILVKMPEQEKTSVANLDNLTEAANRRREFKALKERNEKLSTETQRDNKKLCRYLRSKRHRITKITPIHEEPENMSEDEKKSAKTQSKLYCLNIQSCWQANELEVETFQTQTKILKKVPDVICDQQKNMKQSSAPTATAEKLQCPVDTQKPQDIKTISGSLLKSSAQYQVSLHKYGSLIESHNNNNTLDTINSPHRRKCPRLDGFHWLLRPFRSKHRKRKPKQIQAVVYKTYFVKWTKPPDTFNHGYSVKPLHSSNDEISVLRRCRSATF